jgi:hypothetical protein
MFPSWHWDRSSAELLEPNLSKYNTRIRVSVCERLLGQETRYPVNWKKLDDQTLQK